MDQSIKNIRGCMDKYRLDTYVELGPGSLLLILLKTITYTSSPVL